MDSIARNWLYNTANKHQWRMFGTCEFDDLIQEGYATWYFVKQRYPDATAPEHIMSLFKRIYLNRLHDIARHASAELPSPPDHLECTDAKMALLVAEAPGKVKTLLEKLIANPKPLAAPCRIRKDGTRQTLNERFCRLLGVSPRDFDLHAQLLSLLRSDSTSV